MKKLGSLFVALMLFILPGKVYPEQTSDQDQVQSAIAEFLDAFTRLEWDRFRTSFTEDATVFLFPMPERTTVEGSFGPLFELIRKQVGEREGPPSHPPYFQLNPENVNINIHRDSAIVTFHLRGLTAQPGQLGRRTLVMFRDNDKWRIAHLHASYSPETSPNE